MVELLYFILFIVSINILTSFKRSNVLGCGLVGFSGSDDKSFNIGLIRTLLWHNSVTRGKHATGIFTPSMGIIKDAKEAKDFFKDDVKMSLLEENDSYLMGHVRHATVGDSSNADAAHPWDFEDIIMMHNGTLKNHEEIAKDYKIENKDWIVDSQVLGLAIKQNFKDNKPFKVLTEYIGAAAVVLYHKERKSLFVYRDEERTLFYGYLNDDIYISSLDDILNVIGCENIKAFEPYKVYEIKDGKVLNKVLIKRKKANKNNIIGNIVKTITSLIYYQWFSSDKVMLDDYYTGFHRSVMKSKLFENYQIPAKATTTSNSVFGKITRGNFYKMIRVIDEKKFIIKDDKGEEKEVSIDLFDYENYIPLPNSYVIAIDAPHNTSLKKGEFYECLYHRFGFDAVIIRDHINNKNIYSTLSNFRIATEEEIKEYFKSEPDTCTIVSIIPQTEQLMLPIEDSSEKEIPLVDAEVIIEEEDEDEAVDIRDLVITNMLTCFKHINEEIETILDGNINDLNVELEESLRLISLVTEEASSSDFKFIANYNENTITNLETT